MKAITAAKRHEVGLHGWIHERNSQLDRVTELDLLSRAAAALESITGSRPVGMRTPSWDYSPHTIEIARTLGLIYDSSLMADDRPYEYKPRGARLASSSSRSSGSSMTIRISGWIGHPRCGRR